MKRCSECGVSKPATAFHKNRAKRDGLHGWCRECRSTYNRDAYRDPAHPAHAGKVAIKISEHPYAWTNREGGWRRQKIECLPGCSANDGWLCRTHYIATWDKQGGRCALCGGLLFRGLKPYPSADHHHRDPDGRGPFRGVLHGGRIGCNTRILAAYENGKRFGNGADEACRAYLLNPPSGAPASWTPGYVNAILPLP